MVKDNTVIHEFESRKHFRVWLEKNHSTSNGVWLLLNKGSKAFSAHDALEEALCFGWIDGQMKSIDEKKYKKYFSKRREKGNWSEKNKKLFKKLQKDGLATQAGIDAYKITKNEKSVGEISGIERTNLNIRTLQDAFKNDAAVLRLFEACCPSRQKQLAGFYCDAKTEETRTKRKTKITEALKSGNKGMLY